MTLMPPSLGVVLTELGPEAKVLVEREDSLALPVAGASIWAGRALAPDPQVILVVANGEEGDELQALLSRLPDEPQRILVLTSPSPLPTPELQRLAGRHTVLEAGGTVDPADVVLAVSRAAGAPAENVTRRLATLQRSLTQALAASEPLPALLGRLRSASNAHVALVDKQGRSLHATGPVPLSLLFEEISRTGADSQMLDVDGWRGVADKIHDPDRPGEYIGWLIVTSRRSDFPDQYSAAAVHVAAALVEACYRMTLVARQQERAIKAAVLEEALALRRVPDDPDLAGRAASFGLNVAEGVRIAILKPLRAAPTARGAPALEATAEDLAQALRDASIPHLLSRRERHLVVAVQCSPAMLKRAVVASPSIPNTLIGVGRVALSIGEIPLSHGDARLAIRTLQRGPRGPRVLGYEDFDFAMRLFSEVGVERMGVWARDFLRPLVDRPALLEGLSAYFRHSQNMNAAADALSIHHNSLRYRLAKIEELLNVSLREPATFSSLFLASTALEHEMGTTNVPTVRGAAERPVDVDAPHQFHGYSDPSLEQLGVVLSPERP
ncbi:PucR family transcriptional regulator [Pedococcus sp. 5OH_020]|uniref:PucR family transcriptional regulator n=1 Tax=Pedococcus sp. 5OH_020 TaxID=2989814 RepID=UPI0022E9DF79|nr:helix-turn-helix domain-containing protein [Pedococcus sp. 5OH_020]